MAFFTKTIIEKLANKVIIVILYKCIAYMNIEAIQYLPIAGVRIKIINPKTKSLDNEIY
jgi:hypothetical protein